VTGVQTCALPIFAACAVTFALAAQCRGGDDATARVQELINSSGVDARLTKSAVPEIRGAKPVKTSVGPYRYPASNLITVDASAMGDCFAMASSAYGGSLSLDKNRMDHTYDFNDFFAYLYASPRRTYDYATGQEDALKEWIMGQLEDSIDPVALYRASLNLNRGNIWNALLTIHQLLRNLARYDNKTAYRTNYTEADAAPVFNRLIDIRGDLTDRGASFKGDHRGTWYRIWGIMLYRLIGEPESEGVLGAHQNTVPQTVYRDTEGQAVASVAEWVKPLLGIPESDKKKVEMNRIGSSAASAFIQALDNPKRQYPLDAWNKCQRRAYLIR
jgi:hypothetical protein